MDDTLRERWDALRARILDEDDKILFDEASRCSTVDAQRSAYIMVWLAVAASIRRKLKEMTIWSAQIGEAVDKLNDTESKRRAIDSGLLNSAKNLGLIDDFELKKLRQIQSLRDEYAHPRNVQPSPEEVVGAAAAAVECVLEKPARLGEDWANDLIDDLFTDPTYLDDTEAAVERFANRRFDLLQPDVRPRMFRTAITRLEDIVDDPTVSRVERRLTWFLRRFIQQHVHAGASLSDWPLEDVRKRARKATAHVLGVPGMWPHLDVHLQDQLLGTLLGEGDTPTSAGLSAVWALADGGALNDRQQERWRDAVARVDLSLLHDAGLTLEKLVSRVVSDLNDFNWEVCNPAARFLLSLGPDQVAALNENEARTLGEAAGRAYTDFNSFGARDLILQTRYDERWPDGLRAGFVVGACVDEDGEVRVAPETKVRCAIRAAAASANPERVFESVGSLLAEATPYPPDYRVGHDMLAAMFENLVEQMPEAGSFLNALASVVREAAPADQV